AERSEWSIDTLEIVRVELRGRPAELQILLVACPRNQSFQALAAIAASPFLFQSSAHLTRREASLRSGVLPPCLHRPGVPGPLRALPVDCGFGDRSNSRTVASEHRTSDGLLRRWGRRQPLRR